MKYVLDASVAIKWVLPEVDSAQAVALRADFLNRIHELIVPDTFPVEVAHALTRAERRGVIAQTEALIRLADVLSVGVAIHPYLPLLPRAVEISSDIRLGVYDCVYIALAERESCLVVTADQKMASAIPALTVALATL